MNNNDDFSQLWNQQKITDIPDIKELLQIANSYKRKTIKKIILANIMLLSTVVFICFIWYYYQPALFTTKIGIVLIIIAIISFVIASNKTIPLLNKINATLNSTEHLHRLIHVKEKQLFLQKTMMTIYFILLSAGLFLYMLEYTKRMMFGWALVSYGITAIWIAFNWFYIRPKTMNKQQKELNGIIEKLKKVNDQLKSN